MLLLCCCIVAASGCALWELTPKPTDGAATKTTMFEPPESAYVMQPKRTVAEKYDGETLTERTTTEYSMPTAMKEHEFRGDSAFVEQERSYSFDSNSDGIGVAFDATQVINEKALAESATAQVARSAQANELIASGLNVLGQVAGVYVNFLNAQSQRENTLALRQVELEEARHAAEMAAMHEEPEAPAEDDSGSGAAGGAAAGAAVLGAALAIDRFRKRGEA